MRTIAFEKKTNFRRIIFKFSHNKFYFKTLGQAIVIQLNRNLKLNDYGYMSSHQFQFDLIKLSNKNHHQPNNLLNP
ncbi:unnamed protein product [Paramecium sonneborni]|uniref:Uncharacterized protein n=1 Tax=Paramecium sonneborni TaxID=65129 RepID=A0A8S1MJU9_9CILI|nr:unnamed protein product [Paramecium sonneborni]